MRALESAETARSAGQVDSALAAATNQILGLTHRRFYPTVASRWFDGPLEQLSSSWRLWLGRHELISATAVIVDGVTLGTGDYFLRPEDGPPYTRIEINWDSSAGFVSGQRKIQIDGEFGHSADTAAAGTLTAAVTTTTATTLSLSDSAAVGVGDLVCAGTERMTVTEKSMADTGVNIDPADSLTASPADVQITLSTATAAPVVGETILIDAERMLVVDRAGLAAVVKRAWDGSVLAAHAGGADIYAPRTATVERGVLGTTAATHLLSAAVTRHVPPPLISAYAVAEAMNTLLNEGSGYARTAGAGENAREYWGRALSGLRDQVLAAYGRQARMAAI